jgi:hypothetical protein
MKLTATIHIVKKLKPTKTRLLADVVKEISYEV